MILLRILLFAILTAFALGGLAGQSPEKRKTSPRAPQALERAEALRQSDPASAIGVLSELIQSRPSTQELTEAFLLLGDIYADIGQPELALGRYARALEVLPAGQNLLAASLYQRRGEVNRELGDLAAARTDFARCLSLAPALSAQKTACQEGLADLEASENNLSLSQSYYQQAQDSRPTDSVLQVRVNAKRADVYLQQNDLVNSANSLNQALEKVPRAQALPPDDSRELISANTNLRSAVIKAAPNLDREITEVLPAAPIPLLATDNFARFQTLRELGRLPEAERQLRDALQQLDSLTPAEISTEIYAAGADYYLDRRQPTRAAEIYRAYTVANDRLLAEKREEVNQLAAVLRAQQDVDLGLKDLSAAEAESQFLSQQVSLQRWLIYLLAASLLGALVLVAIILRNVRKRRRANQELLLRNLQTRMNPHFIFNSLNSINNYIARQDERSANRYLGRFAKLMRNVLDQSGKDFVPLAEELEQLALYLELEKERFGEQFRYQLVSPAAAESLEVPLNLPPMILQPFVENAIWHGLRYRPEGGALEVRLCAEGRETYLEIIDNGIGRARSAALKTANQLAHRSTGVATTQKRLELINEHYGTRYWLHIEDAFPAEEFVGTRVRLALGRSPHSGAAPSSFTPEKQAPFVP
ncbi:histidine kinase [Neolewinella lacunae]|uniref:Histidine kinase n=1 Tax=Neolewinella lacunae TaxID=1517758 RepID=A0A923T6L4_9BACT|nr:histidine kinase [Neolewinella lacunae]MBC6993550.1 histidine kinase [Neolewinella lacunae]MDN3636174.1 histidine kinase [Neolewinella lacunae]